uniref:Uncharacterized protein n=1 Tax=Oryza sativa subsp. japonica TaxID=39947 RepID=Q6F2M1_ORYSJ|nr:hypothetical protein [Oryza sativa Japonica Group]AAU90094.1 hypothetical protein [Oryza sativa Japonica Group]
MPSIDAGDALFCGGVEPPTLTAVSDLAATTDDATVSDAAELALLDAPVPTTFPAGASDAVAAFARFIGSLGKKIFQVEDSFAEGYDKLRLSAYDALGAWRKSIDGVVGGLTASVDATKKQAASGMLARVPLLILNPARPCPHALAPPSLRRWKVIRVDLGQRRIGTRLKKELRSRTIKDAG